MSKQKWTVDSFCDLLQKHGSTGDPYISFHLCGENETDWDYANSVCIDGYVDLKALVAELNANE